MVNYEVWFHRKQLKLFVVCEHVGPCIHFRKYEPFDQGPCGSFELDETFGLYEPFGLHEPFGFHEPFGLMDILEI